MTSNILIVIVFTALAPHYTFSYHTSPLPSRSRHASRTISPKPRSSLQTFPLPSEYTKKTTTSPSTHQNQNPVHSQTDAAQRPADEKIPRSACRLYFYG